MLFFNQKGRLFCVWLVFFFPLKHTPPGLKNSSLMENDLIIACLNGLTHWSGDLPKWLFTNARNESNIIHNMYDEKG